MKARTKLLNNFLSSRPYNEFNYEQSWQSGFDAAKDEILSLLKEYHLGVGNYGDNNEIEGTIHRLEVMDKIRKL